MIPIATARRRSATAGGFSMRDDPPPTLFAAPTDSGNHLGTDLDTGSSQRIALRRNLLIKRRLVALFGVTKFRTATGDWPEKGRAVMV
jgi:hypothetical protein